MKPETNSFNMHYHPILNDTSSLKAHREVGLKFIDKFYPTDRQENKLMKKQQY